MGHTAVSGCAYGGTGQSASTSGRGVYGGSAGGMGVYVDSASAHGVYAHATSSADLALRLAALEESLSKGGDAARVPCPLGIGCTTVA